MKFGRLQIVSVFAAAALAGYWGAAKVAAPPSSADLVAQATVGPIKNSTAELPQPVPLSSDDIHWIVLRAMLRTIATPEARWEPGGGDRAYRTVFGGGQIVELNEHPENVVCAMNGDRVRCSSATGGFQFMPETMAGLHEIHSAWYPGGPLREINQDLAAYRLLREIGAWAALEGGIAVRGQVVFVDESAVKAAIEKSARTWCGLPGYNRGECSGQPTHTEAQVIEVFYRELEAQQRPP